MPQVTANLTDQQYNDLVEIARERGLDANTVLQQAIATEKLISQNVSPEDDLVIRRPNKTETKFEFSV